MDELSFVQHWEIHNGQQKQANFLYFVKNGVIEEVFHTFPGEDTAGLLEPPKKGMALDWYKGQAEGYNAVWSGKIRCKYGCPTETLDIECTRGVQLFGTSPEAIWEEEITDSSSLEEVNTGLLFTVLLAVKKENQGRSKISRRKWVCNPA